MAAPTHPSRREDETPLQRVARLGLRRRSLARKAPLLRVTEKEAADWADWQPSFAGRMHRQARKNAALRKIEFDITPDDIKNLYVKQVMRCAVSRIKFSTEPPQDGKRRPFAPSLDRIDSARGYLRDNVRLVCQIVNMAMNEWGEGPLRELVRQMSRSHDR